MMLQLATQLNKKFKEGSRPTKKEWISAIERGEINGKVAMGKVWVDVDDFNAKDIFGQPAGNDELLDVLNG